jgi:hypothetical protein
MKLEFSRHVAERRSNIKLDENPVHWEPSCAMRIDGQTNGQTWRSWFALRNSANAPKSPVGTSDNQAEMPHRTIPKEGGTQTTRPLLSPPPPVPLLNTFTGTSILSFRNWHQPSVRPSRFSRTYYMPSPTYCATTWRHSCISPVLSVLQQSDT